jgi:signal transduction histidine kinase
LDDLTGTIKIAISDHGDGAERSTLQKGQGLATMQARAERLDGKLSIHNYRGSGFRVELEFPAYARN